MTREAAVDRTENWAHMSQGALYSALRRCETDGLIEPVRHRAGRQVPRPHRVPAYRGGPGCPHSYQVRGLAADRAAAGPVRPGAQCRRWTNPQELRGAIQHRVESYVEALDYLRQEFDMLGERLEPTAVAVFEHVMMRHETEIAWHRRLLEQVDTFATPPPAPQDDAR